MRVPIRKEHTKRFVRKAKLELTLMAKGYKQCFSVYPKPHNKLRHRLMLLFMNLFLLWFVSGYMYYEGMNGESIAGMITLGYGWFVTVVEWKPTLRKIRRFFENKERRNEFYKVVGLIFSAFGLLLGYSIFT